MDWDFIFKGLSIFISVLALLIAYFRTRRQDIERRFLNLEERTQNNQSEIKAVNQKIEAMPNSDHFHRLEIALTELTGEVKVVSQAVKGQHEILNRIDNTVGIHQEHLMKGAGK